MLGRSLRSGKERSFISVEEEASLANGMVVIGLASTFRETGI